MGLASLVIPTWAKAAAVAAVGLAGAVGGWTVASWRAEAALAAQAQATVAALATQARAALVLHDLDTAADARLAADVQTTRNTFARLNKELTSARNITVPGSCAANPFGVDFQRLWNDAANNRDAATAAATSGSAGAVPAGAGGTAAGVPQSQP